MTERELTTISCRSCGADQAPEAQFCAECGVAAVDPGDVGPDPQPEQPQGSQHQTLMLMLAEQGGAELVPESAAAAVESASGLAVGQFRRPRRWRAIVGGVLALSIVAGVAVLALNDWGTHKQLTKSRDAYSASQSRLHETQAELADTVTKLTGVKTDLTSTQSVLATTKKSLDAKAQALTAKEQELAGVRNNLTDVKSSLTIQSGQIKTLESCLNGVSIALTDVSYNDYSGAASALEAVKVSCNAAFALF